MSKRFQDWYDQGIRDLEKAKLDFQHEYWEWACFTAQQSAEKILKSLAMYLGLETWGHSLTEITKILKEFIEIPEELIEQAQTLDIYYTTTRYPNSFTSGKPADYFNKKNAEEAIDAADYIIRFCKSHLP
jgi:HEPN domain-containing protein